ncbi:hypothetical protein [Streptomyces sp. NPDC018711]|uniref:hypothetical protein n=1 Tax=Streptomyces sp. NPDC018711 TaxID=3365052 RepID=UPI0037BDF542
MGIGGGTLGLILGGVITQYASWRWTLLVNLPIGLAVLLLTRRFVTETPRRSARFDLAGAASATGSAVAFVWTLTTAPDRGWTGLVTVGGLAAGVLLAVVLAVAERRAADPLMRPDLLRDRRRIAGLAAIVSVYATGAVPGEFVPGASAAFLATAGLALAACLSAALVPRTAAGR